MEYGELIEAYIGMYKYLDFQLQFQPYENESISWVYRVFHNFGHHSDDILSEVTWGHEQHVILKLNIYLILM